MKIYQSFDQDQLDVQYNVRAGIANHLDIFAGWKESGAKFRASHNTRENIHYGEHDLQTFDFFSCEQDNRPVLVFIHGGYWQSLDKSDFSCLAAPYIQNGVNVAVVNYRLAPQAKMVDMVSDNIQAIKFLYENASALGLDRNSIFVSGHSAGGHLTATMAGTDWQQYDLPRDAVKGICAISGLYDLEPIRLSYLNKVIGLVESDVAEFSPLHHLPHYKLPIILTVGGDESGEYHRLQAQYAAALIEKGFDVHVVSHDDGHHFDVADRLGFGDHELSKEVLDMINKSR